MELGKTYICDDTIFNASCINHVVVNEICWPIVQKKGVLVRMLPKFLNFEKVKNKFDSNEELNKSLELFGSMFFMDIDNIVTIICHLNMLKRDDN
jgi:hypothetical protein